MSGTSASRTVFGNPDCGKGSTMENGSQCRCGTIPCIDLIQGSVVNATVVRRTEHGVVLAVAVRARSVNGFLRIQDPADLSRVTVGCEVLVRVVSPTGHNMLHFRLPDEGSFDFFNVISGRWSHLAMVNDQGSDLVEEHGGKAGNCDCGQEEF